MSRLRPFPSNSPLHLSRLQTVLCVFAVLASVNSGAWLPADDTATDGKLEQAFLEDAKAYVIESPKDSATLILHEKSLLNWTNPVRQQERGNVYVWLLDGRPLVIGSLFTYIHNDKVYEKHEFHSLASKPLQSTYAGKLAWTPRQPGIEWHDFKDSPEPGRTHTVRLLQMRQLARPFRAELINSSDDKTELRLVSRPLFEYTSARNKVIDGAIFSFAVATDPEVLILMEAYEDGDGPDRRAAFRYAFARFHYWNVCVFEGDKKIWDAPLDRSHESNVIGDRENMVKVYISYRPKP